MVTIVYRVRVSTVVRESLERAEETNRKIHAILEKEGIYIETSAIDIEGRE